MSKLTARSLVSGLGALALALSFAACGGDGASSDANRAGRSNASNGAAPSSNNAAGSEAGVTGLAAEIERLERQAERSPGDDEVRSALAAAYVRRGNFFRAANDLRAALKDYRSALRYDEDNEEAQTNAADLSVQLEGAKEGEYGEPQPPPISPNVTTGSEEPTPAAEPSPAKRKP